MNDGFLAYLQQLELIAFFSGYPLIYAISYVIAGNTKIKKSFVSFLIPGLPFSYALLGILYLGLQLKNLHPDYSLANIKSHIQYPYLVIWALLAILFFLPVFRKKNQLTLIHSFAFFALILIDLFKQFSTGNGIVQNDMKVYSFSLLLNCCTLLVVTTIFFFYNFSQKKVKN